MKKIICLLLTVMMLGAMVSVAFAETTDAKLREIYQDGMLFRQNAVSSVAGTAKSGSKIEIEFRSADNTIKAEGTAEKDGTFAVDFTAPAGGYTEYTMTAKQNGVTFATLKNVVFGELWIASGQSNMQYDLGGTYEGIEMKKEGKKGSEWLRILYVQPLSIYNGVNTVAVKDVQEESIGCVWFSADTQNVFSCSAVGYYFGADLQKKLDMPVGIISCALGGSMIASWLSREAIDGNNLVKNELVSRGEYRDYNEWKAEDRSQVYDMTANYNMKLYPLRHLGASGFIWYQGESDVIFGHSTEFYGEMVNLLQETFTENFRYDGDSMPMVFTQLAAFHYGSCADLFNEMNNAYLDIQQEKADSRAVVAIYDVPLDFMSNMGPIHPGYKQPVGERMAHCAYNLVYDKTDGYTTATVSSAVIKDGKVYVTYKNTGDGLMCGGEKLLGFSVCGENGVYVKADAEIVSADTVAVWCDSIEKPVSACYAYVLNNSECNLYASENGEKTLPAGSFITDKAYMNNLYDGMFFADYNTDKVFHNNGGNADYFDAWESVNCDASYNENGLNITAETTIFTEIFSVSPVFKYKKNNSNAYHQDVNRDFTDYGTLEIELTNNSTTPVELHEIRFYTGATVYYSAVCDYKTAADGKTVTVTVDLNSLYKYGNRGGICYTNEMLSEITGLKFVFCADGGNDIDLTINSFTVTADDEERTENTYPTKPDNSGNLFEYFTSLFLHIFSWLKSVC